jgi:dipeptidyl aminopeptidase/acylaminoacyl peptidase
MRSLFLVIAVGSIVVQLSAQDATYEKPAKEVLEVLHAPLPPTALLSPNRRVLILAELNRYPAVAELAEPMLRLAGLRINPKTNGRHGGGSIKSLKLRGLENSLESLIALPPGLHAGAPQWNATSTQIAFIATGAESIEPWIVDAATAQARKIPGVRLNGALGFQTLQWMPDNETLLVRMVPANRPPPPQPPSVPPGPKVLNTTATRAASSTYEARDLLRTPHDADLFEYYMQSQMALIHVPTGKVTPLGKPGVYTTVEPAPDGKHLLVERIERPYSYLRPYSRFPKSVEIWDTAGKLVENVASIPLADRVPIRGVETGPRGFEWHPTDPATLIWVEALDGGDPKTKVAHRDKVLIRPLGSEPQELFRLAERASGMWWIDKENLFMIGDFDQEKHWRRTWIHRRGEPSDKARLLWSRSSDDLYGNPGFPLSRVLPTNHSLVRVDGDDIFLRGQGASAEGDRPFLDRLNLKTLETTRLFRCDRNHRESAFDWIDLEAGSFLTRRESPSEYPNYFVRTLDKQRLANVASGEASFNSSLQPVTSFPDPFPMLKGLTKERLTAHRPDGVAVHFTLYLPPNHKPGVKLPTVFWAYPLDYTETTTAGQVQGSTKEFTLVGGTSNLFFLLQGYAVMEVSMPVVGPVETAYDTFIEQLEANAKAAIDKASELGVIDRDRIGVGGHSHGALMTATFMAHSQLFRAGIARSGAYNHTLRPFGFQNEKRTLYEAKETYVKLSPLIQADKIKRPLLLIHGELDSNPGTVPVQSEKLFEALRGLGANARLVMLPYEDHGYSARESTEHVLYEMIAWFDLHVKNAEPGHAASGR